MLADVLATSRPAALVCQPTHRMGVSRRTARRVCRSHHIVGRHLAAELTDAQDRSARSALEALGRECLA